jgi:hypothetical protein
MKVIRGFGRCRPLPYRPTPLWREIGQAGHGKRRRLENDCSCSRRLRKVDLFERLGCSERFVTRPRRVAAFPAADHVVVRPEALHRCRAPERRTAVVFRRVFVRPFTIDIHPGVPQMPARRTLEGDYGQFIRIGIDHRMQAVKPPPSSDCRQPPRAPA